MDGQEPKQRQKKQRWILGDERQGTGDRDNPWHLAYGRKRRRGERKKRGKKMFEVETDLGLAAQVGMSRWLAWASHTTHTQHTQTGRQTRAHRCTYINSEIPSLLPVLFSAQWLSGSLLSAPGTLVFSPSPAGWLNGWLFVSLTVWATLASLLLCFPASLLPCFPASGFCAYGDF